MDKIVDHIFEYRGNGAIKDFPGNYTQLRDSRETSIVNKPSKTPTETDKQQFIAPPKSKKAGPTYREKKEIERLVSEIAILEAEKKTIEEELSSGKLQGDSLLQKSMRYGEVKRLLDESELRWLELNE